MRRPCPHHHVRPYKTLAQPSTLPGLGRASSNENDAGNRKRVQMMIGSDGRVEEDLKYFLANGKRRRFANESCRKERRTEMRSLLALKPGVTGTIVAPQVASTAACAPTLTNAATLRQLEITSQPLMSLSSVPQFVQRRKQNRRRESEREGGNAREPISCL